MQEINLIDAWNSINEVPEREEVVQLKRKILKQGVVEDALVERVLSLDKTVGIKLLAINSIVNSESELREELKSERELSTKLSDENDKLMIERNVRIGTIESQKLKIQKLEKELSEGKNNKIIDSEEAIKFLKRLGYVVYRPRRPVTKNDRSHKM